MPLEIQTEPRDGYLYVEASGKFDYDKAQGCLERTLAMCGELGVTRMLVDIHGIEGPVGVMERHGLARFLVQNQKGPVRMAIVGPGDTAWSDPFFEDVAVNRGGIVKMTTELNEALEWLEV